MSFPGALVGVARSVPGSQWIGLRDEELRAGGALPVTFEQMWWREALGQLHTSLREHALWPGPTIRRSLMLDERGQMVTLYVETVARAPEPGAAWGLPLELLQTPLPRCPNGGDTVTLEVSCRA